MTNGMSLELLCEYTKRSLANRPRGEAVMRAYARAGWRRRETGA